MDIQQTDGISRQAISGSISAKLPLDQGDASAPGDSFVKNIDTGKAPYTVEDFFNQKFATGGTILWTFPAGQNCGKAAVLPDSSLVFRNDDNTIFCLDGKTGQKKWSIDGGEGRLVFKGIDHPPWNEAPSSDSLGNVYLHDCSSTIYSIDGKTGAHKEFEAEGELSTPVVSNPDGIVAYGTKEGKICAIEGKTGKKLWDFKVPDMARKISYSPENNSFIALDNNSNTLFSLDPSTGKKNWKFTSPSPYVKDPLIDGDGRVYVASWNDHRIFVLDGKTGKKLTTIDTKKMFGDPDAVAPGVVYLSGVLEGPPKVTAVDEKTGNTLWVTDRKDTTLDVIPGSKGSLFFRGWEKIYAVDPKTGEDKWVYKSKDLISGVIFGSEDTMIFDEQGTIKALYVSEEAKLLAQEKKGGTDSAPASEISVEDEYIDIGGVRLPVHHASAS